MIAGLGSYVEYVNPTPTVAPYPVTIGTPESLSITDGASNAFTYLYLGPAYDVPGKLNDFDSYSLQEADCVNCSYQYIPPRRLDATAFSG